ncbi:MAG: hypothetical protein ACYCSR_05325, partial [Thiomonas sp.]
MEEGRAGDDQATIVHGNANALASTARDPLRDGVALAGSSSNRHPTDKAPQGVENRRHNTTIRR